MKVDPYILIGGASRRFGCDKATFEFEGETLAGRAVRLVETALAGSTAIFVAAGKNQFDTLNNRRTISDAIPGLGAFGAVSTALAHASAEWTFVLACDLPFVSDGFLRLLASLADEDYDVIVPVQPDGRWQPVCALYHTARCRDVFKQAISDRECVPSLRAIIDSLNARIVTFAEYSTLDEAEHLLQNINERADLARRP